MILDAPFPPDYRVEKEALTLIEQGHEVFLFCLDYKKKFHQENYKGIVLIHYPSNTFTYKLSALVYTFPFYTWIMKRKIRHFVKNYQPQVVHVHDMVIADAALAVAKKFGVRAVLDLHENRPAIMREYRHLNRWPGKVLINLSTWKRKQFELANEADKIIVVTTLAKEDLIRETKKKPEDIIVVPNTSTLSFSREVLNKNIVDRMRPTFNLLYIGDTSLRRGTDDCIKAIAVLKERIPYVRLWLVGTSSADMDLQELVKSLNVKELVNFEGWQSQSLFASYITGSHVCLSPLKRNPHHDTTFANKLFQYMSFGKPVLVSDCTAQAELVQSENCGLVYPAENVEAMVERIMQFYNDNSLGVKLGANGKDAVENRWTWEKTSEALIKMYQVI